MTRLSSQLQDKLSGVHLPDYDRTRITNGILHIGAGNFHRAHQAVYTDDILKHDPRWGILGASLRSPVTRNRLKAQDFLYSVCECGSGQRRYRIIGSIFGLLHVLRERAELMAAFSMSEIKVITLTVTEKGYCQTVSGELDEGHPDVLHDFSNEKARRSMPGVLVDGLRARRAAGAGPITIVSCDNLSGNGSLLKQVVLDFARSVDPSLSDWCESHVGFPETMVDRIVPQPTDVDRSEFARVSGARDEAALVTEPFRQWVIEDKFLAERPPWEAAGAQIVKDVALFESVKLRMLNAAHSALAYLGMLSGYDYIHEAIGDETLATFVDYLLRHEVIPVLDAPKEISLENYQQSLVERFRNAAIAYTTAQVATDGSKKLSQRILPSIQDALERGRDARGLTLVVAAWLECMSDKNIATRFSDPAKGLMDESELLAAAGVNREIARGVLTTFRAMKNVSYKKEILAILGDF